MTALSILFFLSGATGLLYEVVWIRMLGDVLGSAAWSMTAVFAVFLLGLATGAELFGRRVGTGLQALRRYASLEAGVAVTAAVSFGLLRFWSEGLALHSPAVGDGWSTAGYAVAVALPFVGLPALFMGGTLPCLVAAATHWTSPHRAVPLLYGWNTLGAAAGALATGFALIWLLGLTGTVILGTAVSLGVAAWAGVLAARAGRSRGHAVGAAAGPGVREIGVAGPVGSHPQEAPTKAGSGLWVALAVMSGAGTLAYEVLWGRVAHFILGDRTLAVSALLFVFIAALGCGSLLAPVLARRLQAEAPPAALRLAAQALLVGTLIHLVLTPLAVGSAGGGVALALAEEAGTVGRLLLTVLLVFPGVLVLGVVFPLLAWSAGSLEARPGAVVGRLYLVNTAGAAAGAVAAALLLTSWTGTPRGFLLVSFVGASVAVSVLVRSGAARGWRLLGAGGLSAMVLTAALFPQGLGYVRQGELLLEANEDAYGAQVLVRAEGSGYLRVRNNRVSLVFDLGHPQTRHAQEMAAHLPTLLAGGSARVLNVGTGYGITAGTHTLYPSLGSLETVEILPFLVEAQGRFAPYNYGYLGDPRVTLVQGDGRHHLAADEGLYDILGVNVLDPYLPGSSALYTVEFWELARSRLADGGVFTQLFWGEDLDLLLRGLGRVFSTVLLFEAYGGTSFNVLAFRDPVTREDAVFHWERLSPEARQALTEILGAPPEESLPGRLDEAWERGQAWMARAEASHGPLHTDDRPVLEYRWAHGVPGVSAFDSPLVSY